MPGPKRLATPSLAADASLSIVSDVDLSTEGLACPPVDPYITVRKVRTKTPDGIVEDEERTWTRKGLAAWLAACPKVQVTIPLDPINDPKDVSKAQPHYVIWDGIRIPIKKGRPQLVPLPIADVIANMQAQYRTAQSQGIDLYTINPDDPSDRGYEIPALAG